jgi:putative cell wall-binding protein
VGSFPIRRLEGPDRYATAVEVSKEAFPSPGTVDSVVVGSGQSYADTLVGAGLAGAVDGPLLLVGKDHLPSVVADELDRLDVDTVYVIGGSAAVSDGVAADLAAHGGGEVVRIGGTDRYGTAAMVAAQVAAIEDPSKVMLVSGADWPDAASASSVAYAKGYPILLAAPGGLDPPTEAQLSAFAPVEVLVVGGTGAVSEAALTRAGQLAGSTPLRLAGVDRYDTCAKVATHAQSKEGFSIDAMYVSTGEEFADALVGGSIAGSTARPLLLARPKSLPGPIAEYLRARRYVVDEVVVLGGSGAVRVGCLDGIDEAMAD